MTSSGLYPPCRILLGALLAASLTLVSGCARKESVQPRPQTASSNEPASSWSLVLTTSPEHPSMTKPITFVIHIADQHGQPVADAQVKGILTMKVMDMGVTQLAFAPKGNGDYSAPANSLDMSGSWSLAVEAMQDGTHVKKTFEVAVGD